MIIVLMFVLMCGWGEANLEQPHEVIIGSCNSKIFCRTMGKGKPLVVIHGGPGLCQDYLLPHLYELAKNNLVIFYDQRGCGRSTGEINEETMTIRMLVDDLETLRKTLNFDKISLLGHSWGGLLAMHYAIAYPQCVDKLILSNSEPASSDEIALFEKEVTRRLAPYQEEIALIQNMPEYKEGDSELHERLNRIVLRTYCHIPEHANRLNLHMSALAALNCTKICQLFWANTLRRPYNLHGALKPLRIPTLILHGNDDVIPSITARNIHNTIENSKYVEIKECGHFPFVEQPQEYFKVLNDFLNFR